MMLIENKKIAITGGAGFIGSHLAEELSKHNEVHIIDNLSTGFKKNIEGFDATFHELDINETEKLIDIFQGCDYVFHLGALASVPESIKNPLTAHQSNNTGTLSVFWAAKIAGIKRVVYSSSSAVYGENGHSTQLETYTNNPISPYAVDKLTGELYANVFNLNYAMEITSLRYQNIFGPKQDPNGGYAAVIPKFCMAIIQGKQAQIYGDGKQTRDFTFVSNVVQANIQAAISKSYGIYNIATNIALTITELYSIIADELGEKRTAEYVELRQGDIKHSCGDISLAQKELSYVPDTNIEKQVRITASWYKNKYLK